MVTIDTLKFKVPAAGVVGWDESKFRRVNLVKSAGGDWVASHSTGVLRPGVNNVTCNPYTGEVVIECSAKCLADNYFAGISVNTYTQMIDCINATGAVELCADSVFSDAVVLRCDAASNVAVANKRETLKALAYLNTSYEKKVFGRGVIETVMFTKQVKTSSLKDKQRHYDKFAELTAKTDNNRQFLKTVTNTGALVRAAVDVIRVESIEVSFAGLRKAYGASDTKLASILTSPCKIHGPRFNRIDKSGPQLELFDGLLSAARSYKGLERAHDKFVRHYGMLYVVESCGGEVDLVRQVLDELGMQNIRRELSDKYMPLIEAHKLKASGLDPVKGTCLDEYRAVLGSV